MHSGEKYIKPTIETIMFKTENTMNGNIGDNLNNGSTNATGLFDDFFNQSESN
jgi:hypothetical protein